MAERMVPIAVRVPQSLRDQMEAHARYHNRKLSDEARAAWEDHVARPLGALNVPPIASTAQRIVEGIAVWPDKPGGAEDTGTDPLDDIS